MAASLVCAGCNPEAPVAPEPPERPGCAAIAQLPRLPDAPEYEAAADLAWDLLGAPDKRPDLRLVEGEYLWRASNGWELWGLTCATMEADGLHAVSYVALRSDKPSGTSLAHELLHAALKVAGDSDPHHTAPEWDAVLPEVNKQLKSAGF